MVDGVQVVETAKRVSAVQQKHPTPPPQRQPVKDASSQQRAPSLSNLPPLQGWVCPSLLPNVPQGTGSAHEGSNSRTLALLLGTLKRGGGGGMPINTCSAHDGSSAGMSALVLIPKQGGGGRGGVVVLRV